MKPTRQRKTRTFLAWGALAIDQLGRDLRSATRVWSRNRGLAVVAVLVLSVGIGATTAMLSFVRAVIVRRVPWPDAQRLVAIHAVLPDRRNDAAMSATWNRSPVSPEAWRDLQQALVFDQVGAWIPGWFCLRPPRSEVLSGAYVSASALRLLGVQPTVGRLFSPEDDDTPSDLVLIGHRMWMAHFGGREDILDRALVVYTDPLNPGLPLRVVGVLPDSVSLGGESPDVLLPIGGRRWQGSEEDPQLRVIARLARGVSLRQAALASEPLVRRLASPESRTVRVNLLRDDEVASFGLTAWTGLVGAGLLLLISCCNVAGLFLKNACSRQQEFAIRQAMGATRPQVLRQIAVEHLLIAGVAAVCGLVCAYWLLPLLAATTPWSTLTAQGVRMDWWVVTFTAGIAVLATLVSGVGPVLWLVGRPSAIRPSSGVQLTTRVLGSQRTIVAVQVAVALVLVVSASVLGGAFLRLAAEPLGFDSTGLAVIGTSVTQDPTWLPQQTQTKGPTTALAVRGMLTEAGKSGWTATARLTDQLCKTPGVVSVAGVESAPFSGHSRMAVIRAVGKSEKETVRVRKQEVTVSYFDVMRIRVLKGRGFEAKDRNGDRVAVVSGEFERRVFGGNAMDQQFVHDSNVYTIVGVAADVRYQRHVDDSTGTYYVLDSSVHFIRYLIVRTALAPRSALGTLEGVVRSAAPHLAVTSTTTMDELVLRSLGEERFGAVLSAGYGGASLALTAIGILFLTARSVVERRREIGVRVALGAGPNHVRAVIVSDAARAMLVGLVTGLPVAYGVSQVLRGFIVGAAPPDLWVLVGASAVLVSVGLSATWLIAHRASRAECASALRE